MQTPPIDVILPAAGVGRRMHLNIPKQYVRIGAKTVLEHTVDALLRCSAVGRIIIGISSSDGYFSELPLCGNPRIVTYEGGAERSDTVRLGLCLVETPFVMVHDAARPLISVEDLNHLAGRCSSLEYGAILACRVSDTLKQVRDGRIVRTVPREDMYRAYTPQLFKTKVLTEALEYAFKNHIAITDDASALECLGYEVEIVEGRADNFKLTTPEDLLMANYLIKGNTHD